MFLGSARRLIRKKPIQNFNKWKIVTGDEIVVTAGKDKGKRGVVRTILRNKNKLIVDGVNYAIKRVPRNVAAGGHLSMEMPMAISNVALVDPTTGSATKIAFRYVDGTKVRVSKKSGAVMPRPVHDRLPDRPTGVDDTPPAAVLEQTYNP